MSLLTQLFAKSPFGALVEHSRKIEECLKQLRPLMQALFDEDYDRILQIQKEISRLEHEADVIKNEIRTSMPKRIMLPVDRDDMARYLKQQDNMADAVEDLAIQLTLRRTVIRPEIREDFQQLLDGSMATAEKLMAAAFQLTDLAEASFGGAEAEKIESQIQFLGDIDWKAEKIQRELMRKAYALEGELDALTIIFYEKIADHLIRVSKHAENTGDALHRMIVKR